jgi:hypothetical protein
MAVTLKRAPKPAFPRTTIFLSLIGVFAVISLLFLFVFLAIRRPPQKFSFFQDSWLVARPLNILPWFTVSISPYIEWLIIIGIIIVLIAAIIKTIVSFNWMKTHPEETQEYLDELKRDGKFEKHDRLRAGLKGLFPSHFEEDDPNPFDKRPLPIIQAPKIVEPSPPPPAPRPLEPKKPYRRTGFLGSDE